MILDALYSYGVKSPVNTLYFNYLPEIRNLMEIGKYQKSPKWENESTRSGKRAFCNIYSVKLYPQWNQLLSRYIVASESLSCILRRA